MELHCAVALGSDYRRSRVPMPLADCLQPWQVPHVFSVCTVAILFGETGLGKCSVPIMSLGKHKNTTVDEWYQVDPDPDLAALGGLPSGPRLRLVLHLQTGEEATTAAPKSFVQRCTQLLEAASPLPSPRDLPVETSDVQPEEEPEEEVELELVQSSPALGTEVGGAEAAEGPTPEAAEGAKAYDEALTQLLAQKEALEREHTELNSHWSALQADQLTKHEVLAEMRAEQRAISSSVDELHSEVLEFTAELKQAQALSSTRLATRRRLQAELLACSTNFKEEATEHRHASEALRQQRAQLRREAVELGKKLQACVSQADALVSENLRLRTESAELEEAEERNNSELEAFRSASGEELLQHCRHALRLVHENGTGSARPARPEDGYSSRVQALREAAERIAGANNVRRSSG